MKQAAIFPQQTLPKHSGRVVVHLDWEPRLASRQRTALKDTLRGADYDATVLAVYGDGLRCVDPVTKELACWRLPRRTLEEVLSLVLQHGAASGRGWWLPTGWNCSCVEKFPLYHQEKCGLGVSISCLPTPSSDDWFIFTEA